MKYRLLLTLFLVQRLAIAQITLVGSLNLKGGISYSYKVVFATPQGGKISGYTLTDIGGKNETKSSIVGEYDSIKNTLSFRETKVLHSKIKVNNQEAFCYVSAQLKKYASKEQTSFQGKFSGMQEGDKQPCAEGQITLIDKQSLIASLEKMENKNEVLSILKQQLLKDNDELDSPQVANSDKILTKAQGLYKLWDSPILNIELWDDGQYDEDRVAIELNNKRVEASIVLQKTSKKFTYNLKKGKNILRIYALNEGKIVPNSAKMKLYSDKNEQETLLSYNQSGDYSEIILDVDF